MAGAASGKGTVYCPRCKFPNSAGAMSCLTCGTLLGTPADQARRATTTRLSRDDLAKVMQPSAPPPPAPAPAWQATPTEAPAPPPVAAPSPPLVRAAPPRVPNALDALARRTSAATALAWLSCPPLPPVPVGEGVVTIGRSEECALVLAHSSVSRTHAVVKVVAGALLFDDRSTFGSYVNGERQVHSQLKVGDVLTIGPYEVRVVARETLETGPKDDGETRPLGTSLRDLPSADAMTGRLEKQPLAEVLQALEFNRKTGTLDLVCGEESGLLVVYEGAPIHADFGGASGEEAVHRMMARTSGYYAFRTKIEAGEQTISKSMTALLLEASRRLDEG